MEACLAAGVLNFESLDEVSTGSSVELAEFRDSSLAKRVDAFALSSEELLA